MYKKSLADLGKKGPEGVEATGTLFLGQQKPAGPRTRELKRPRQRGLQKRHLKILALF